jgi:TrmH family RNA methyltransferase
MITSTANDQIKFIRKLREKKYRNESGLFYIEGIRIVLEALHSAGRIKTLIVAPELKQSDMIEEAMLLAGEAGVPVLEVSAEVFESFSLKEGPKGIAAIACEKWDTLASIQGEHLGLWAGLDEVADPGNLGTIMRTLDAVGATGILLIGPCTDPYDPSAIRASMGAVFSLKFAKVTVEEFAVFKTGRSLFCVGTSDAAKEDYQVIHYPQDMILMMGSERQGLKPELMSLCDHMVSIPMRGKSDSLNLAVATGVMLYEIYNQHRRTTPE